MEGTETLLLPATRVLELYVLPDYIIDCCVVANVGDILIAYPASHSPILVSAASAFRAGQLRRGRSTRQLGR